MQVCLFSSYLLKDATTLRAKNIAAHLVNEGHKVTLIASDYKKRTFFENGIKVRTDKILDIHYIPRYFIKSSMRFYYLLAEKFDILHVFAPMPATVPIAYTIKKIKRKPLVVDWDDWEAAYEGRYFSSMHKRFVSFCEDFIIKKADAVTVASKKLQELAAEYNQEGLYLPNGCDSSKLLNITKEQARETLGIPEDETVFIFTGKLIKEIGLERYLEAFQKLSEGLFYLVGEGDLEYFNRLVRDLKIDNRVVFIGGVSADKIPSFLTAADVGVIPLKKTLYNEAKSPVKLGEYITFDLPILGDKVGEVKNFLGNNGFLITREEEIFSKMKEALKEDRRRRALKDYRKIKEKYEWRNQIKKLTKLYESIV